MITYGQWCFAYRTQLPAALRILILEEIALIQKRPLTPPRR